MTPQDRELLQALNRRQAQLEESLALLKADLKDLERRAEAEPVQPAVVIPPLPVLPKEAVFVSPPPIPDLPIEALPPPLPPLPAIPQTPESSAPVEENPPGLEFQFGRWLARIGVVFALITLITFSTLAYDTLYKYMGPWSKLAALAVVSLGLVAGGLWMERKNSKLTVYGRTLAGGGLACRNSFPSSPSRWLISVRRSRRWVNLRWRPI
jgi:uncharacterized membrane protein